MVGKEGRGRNRCSCLCGAGEGTVMVGKGKRQVCGGEGRQKGGVGRCMLVCSTAHPSSTSTHKACVCAHGEGRQVLNKVCFHVSRETGGRGSRERQGGMCVGQQGGGR